MNTEEQPKSAMIIKQVGDGVLQYMAFPKPKPVPKIILVDMDGVLSNFEAACLRDWKLSYPSAPYVGLQDRRSFDIRDDYSLLTKRISGDESTGRTLMDKIMRLPGFYGTFGIIEGASQALEEMLVEGYEVFICTAPMSNPDCIRNKVDWVQRNLGKQWVERLIVTKDKTLVRGDILIDDNPVITGKLYPSFVHVVFDQPYNREVDNDRIVGWSQWRSVISSVLDK